MKRKVDGKDFSKGCVRSEMLRPILACMSEWITEKKIDSPHSGMYQQIRRTENIFLISYLQNYKT